MRIGLIGSKGKMGHAVQQIIGETPHQITAQFDIDNPVSSKTVSSCDVLIDFSSASAMGHNTDISLQAGIPFITGTTGWYDQIGQIRDKVNQTGGAFLYASNFSIGILLFHRLLAKAAELYGSFAQYDFAVHEIHHNQKADSPSGTAITLAGEILKNLPRKSNLQIGNPDGKIAEDKLQISSTRSGQVPGTHTLYIESLQDSIEITHRAHGRMGFASGAVKAAEWLLGKKGFYSIEDMINTMLKEGN